MLLLSLLSWLVSSLSDVWLSFHAMSLMEFCTLKLVIGRASVKFHFVNVIYLFNFLKITILISELRQQQNGITGMHLQSQPQDTKFRQRHHMKRQQHLRQQRDQQQQRRRPQPQQDQLHQVHVGLNAN